MPDDQITEPTIQLPLREALKAAIWIIAEHGNLEGLPYFTAAYLANQDWVEWYREETSIHSDLDNPPPEPPLRTIEY